MSKLGRNPFEKKVRPPASHVQAEPKVPQVQLTPLQEQILVDIPSQIIVGAISIWALMSDRISSV